MRRLLAILICVVVAASAAPLHPGTRTEIRVLVSKLEASSCEFNRNGSWYSGADAKSHLRHKPAD